MASASLRGDVPSFLAGERHHDYTDYPPSSRHVCSSSPPSKFQPHRAGETLVTRRERAQRRDGYRARHLQKRQRGRDRRVIEALIDDESPAQRHAVSICDVHAEFYINRAGHNLPKERRETLQNAKRELRAAFGRKP
jgi:hypothetical protein